VIRVTGVVAMLLALAAATPAAAAPPVSFGIEVGVVSRDIEEEGGLVVGTASGVAESTRLTARASVALAPGMALFGEVGGADLAVDEFDNYRSDMHLSYGGGLRLSSADAMYPQQPVVFADFRVSRISTDDQMVRDWCVDSACLTVAPRLLDETLAWTEYAVSFGVKGRLQGLRPFGGLQVSKIDGSDHIRPADGGALVESRSEVRESDSVGFFFGADIPLDRQEQTAVVIKFSGIDENAFRVAYRVAF
jgi:hypothetical protein